MTGADVVHVEIPQLRDLMRRILEAAGCDAETASLSAEVFLDADLKGMGLQGLDHMATLVRHLQTGHTRPDARPKVIREEAATVLVDGGRGLGQINALFASDLAVKKARSAGAAVVGVVNSGDVFMIGHYAERMARAGCVALVCTDAPPLVHPHGGTERMLGTNPIAFGFPRGGEQPLLFDMSTSALSASRVRQAAYFDEPLPPGTGCDASGTPSTRASDVRDGAIGPLAGHKGFGLALSVALLSGPLVGAFCGPALASWMGSEPGTGAPRGQLFIAISPAAFGDPAVFAGKVDDYLGQITSSRKAAGFDAIRIPGDRAFGTRAEQRREGKIAILKVVWENALQMAERLGIDTGMMSDRG